jgi:hypothetical protein
LRAEGVVVLASREQEDGEPTTGAERGAENEELSRDVLGMIAAYRMGGAFDAQLLCRAGSATASPQQEERSPV